MHKTCYILLLFLLGLAPVTAQQVRITETALLNQVLEANTQLRISEAAYREARGAFRQTHSIFLPSLRASHTGLTTTNPLTAFGSKLNQEILTQADFNPALLNDPQRTDNFATRLEVEQPLLNVDGLYQRRAAKYKMEASALQHERDREYLRLEAARAYMGLQLAHRAVAVMENAMATAKANEKVARDKYRQGYLQKADLLAVQVRVGEIRNRLRISRSGVADASDYLGHLMNDTLQVVYLPADSLRPRPITDPESLRLSENRADLRAMQLAAEAYKNAYRAEKSSLLPRLNAFGSYELYDDAPFQFEASGYTLGAELSWSVFEGNQRMGRIQERKAAYEKSQLERERYFSKSRLELQKAMRALENAGSELEVRSLALEQSREALRIRTNRFAEGLEKTTELLAAETTAAEKELQYYQTVFEYNYAIAYLEFLASTGAMESDTPLNR